MLAGSLFHSLGAAIENVSGDEVVTLYFKCCGHPAKVYLLRKESNAEKFIVGEDAKWRSGVIGNYKKGNYRVALIARHATSEIIDAIEEVT